jgi:hypothetical protein
MLPAAITLIRRQLLDLSLRAVVQTNMLRKMLSGNSYRSGRRRY